MIWVFIYKCKLIIYHLRSRYLLWMSSLSEDKPELNITPLVDIMLVLLAILMVTTPTIVYQENIIFPRVVKQQKKPKVIYLILASTNRKKSILKTALMIIKCFQIVLICWQSDTAKRIPQFLFAQ